MNRRRRREGETEGGTGFIQERGEGIGETVFLPRRTKGGRVDDDLRRSVRRSRSVALSSILRWIERGRRREEEEEEEEWVRGRREGIHLSLNEGDNGGRGFIREEWRVDSFWSRDRVG